MALMQQDYSPGMTPGLSGFPTARAGERLRDLPSSASELLWHLWFTQRDILNFVRNETYEETKWPDGYWPHDPGGSAREWDAQVRAPSTRTWTPC